jgi:tripartite-type tricarboxylate transporter receptor subunit TctC
MNHRLSSINRRQAALTAFGAIAAAAAPSAFAQPAKWPGKSARIIQPFPVGGGPDGISRVIADSLAKTWGQAVIVDNRPGGNGFIAIDIFKHGATDGTDMLVLDNVHIVAYPYLFKKVPYDLDKDFAVLMPLFRNYFFICVPVNSPYKTMADLIADAKANPGKLNYGSWSVGNPAHLGGALLENMTGTKMVHVIYKETTQLYQSVSTGDLAFALGSLGSAGPMMRAGKLRFLAATSPQRIAGFEDVPTVSESGGPKGYAMTGWNALAVSPKTPVDIQEKIRNDVRQALTGTEANEKLAFFGYERFFPTPAEFKQFVADQSKRFGDVIKQAGLSLS